VRHFDPARRLLLLSEVLPAHSMVFQTAHQIALLTSSELLDELVNDARLTTGDSKALCRVALANYFAAAVLMPYSTFREAALEYRYDIDMIGSRFRTSFEQVCHRLTTLRRPGSEGVPFHFLRVDIAGNISKRYSASGIQFARFSGACPRWNLHVAFLTPGQLRVQLSESTDGRTYFCVARTVERGPRRYHSPPALHAICLGCRVEFARDLVYSDGVDLENTAVAVPVGITCRLCERLDCEQRAFPPLQRTLHIDENQRGVSFYASLKSEGPPRQE
jgi:predicted transcriptional regulator